MDISPVGGLALRHHPQVRHRRIHDSIEAVELRLGDLDLGDGAVAEELEDGAAGSCRCGVDRFGQLDDIGITQTSAYS